MIVGHPGSRSHSHNCTIGMVSLLSRHNINMQNEFDCDFPLYSNPSQMFSPEEIPNLNMQNFTMDPNTYPYQQTAQEYSHAPFQQQFYSEMPMFPQGKHSPGPHGMGSPDTRAPPSNFSTASGPSAASSTMGSPYSNNDHTAMPEFMSQSMSTGPTIMEQDFSSYGGAQEYQFTPSGMDHEYFADIKPGFVGECGKVSAMSSTAHPSSTPKLSHSIPRRGPIPIVTDRAGFHLDFCNLTPTEVSQSPVYSTSQTPTPTTTQFSSPPLGRRFSTFSSGGVSQSSLSSSGWSQDTLSSPTVPYTQSFSVPEPQKSKVDPELQAFFNSLQSDQSIAPQLSLCLFLCHS